jgi:hypothetical protein
MSYRIHCNKGPDPNSIPGFFTNPGNNIIDCMSQCFDNFGNIDCLGATYTAPNPQFSGFDGSENKGTCTFYSFVNGLVDSPGGVAAVFVG